MTDFNDNRPTDVDAIVARKKALRREVSGAVRAMSSEEIVRQSHSLLLKLEKLPQFVRANSIALYWSLPDEVQTHEFISRIAADFSKNIFLPVVDGDRMTFAPYDYMGSMTPGAYNIMEPECKASVNVPDFDLIVVPGVAFDRNCHRMGRGKGYYDRFLRSSRAFRVALCLNEQLVEDVPHEPHDIMMDCVICNCCEPLYAQSAGSR